MDPRLRTEINEILRDQVLMGYAVEATDCSEWSDEVCAEFWSHYIYCHGLDDERVSRYYKDLFLDMTEELCLN